MQNVLQVHAEFLKYEERQQIDSGGGGALSQAAGHDGKFYGYMMYSCPKTSNSVRSIITAFLERDSR